MGNMCSTVAEREKRTSPRKQRYAVTTTAEPTPFWSPSPETPAKEDVKAVSVRVVKLPRTPPAPTPRKAHAHSEQPWERCVVALREGEKKLFGEPPTNHKSTPIHHAFTAPRSQDLPSNSAASKDTGGSLSPTAMSLSGKPESISDWSVSSQENVLPFQLDPAAASPEGCPPAVNQTWCDGW